MLDRIGYRKTYHSRLIRTEHEVVFREGMKAQGIKAYLQKVPDGATFIELRESEGDEIVLAFLEESEDTEAKAE